MQSNEQKNNTADNSDVKNQARSNKDVVTNAILLETSVSQKSSANKKGSTQSMHYMYSLVEYNGSPFLAKITVEEYGNKTFSEVLQEVEATEGARHVAEVLTEIL